MMAYSEDIHEL